MKKYRFITLCMMAILLISCEQEIVLTGITLDKTTLSIPANGSATLVATAQPVGIYGRVKWTSSNPDVATVVDGFITGISAGSAQIVASVGNYTSTCEVTVSTAISAVTLNKTSIRIKVDSTQTLSATLLPSQSAEVAKNLSWFSTNPAVATVDNNGKVTAISNGSTNIVASIGTLTALCSVTVYTKVPASLMGTNYYLINIDNAAADMIGATNIAADYRVEGINNNFYVWNGFNAGTISGSSFYGTSPSWLSLVVTGAGGWSGAAYNLKASTDLNKLKAVTDDTTGRYYLHFAIKSTSSNSYAFKAGYGALGITFVLGTTNMENTAPYGNFTRNGQWQEVEIPISYFKSKGLTYTTGMATTDIFVMLAGGTAGIKLDIDAVFIYKK